MENMAVNNFSEKSNIIGTYVHYLTFIFSKYLLQY